MSTPVHVGPVSIDAPQPQPAGTPLGGRPRLLAAAVLFSCTSLTGAGLLFLVQPMVAKLVLPLFGGSPSVWNTSNLFFQISLLAGYVLTHLSIRRFGVRRQSLLQVGPGPAPAARPADRDPWSA